MPWFIGEWREELGITSGQASEWSGVAVADRFRSELEGPVFFENDGNAGALASMPVPGPKGNDILLHRASLYAIEDRLEHGLADPLFQDWLSDCADAVSFTIIGANSLLDLDAMIVGGTLPDETIQALIAKISARIAKDAPRDFFQPVLMCGRNGEIAPARGAGLLPLFSTFSPNLDSLLKGPAPVAIVSLH